MSSARDIIKGFGIPPDTLCPFCHKHPIKHAVLGLGLWCDECWEKMQRGEDPRQPAPPPSPRAEALDLVKALLNEKLLGPSQAEVEQIVSIIASSPSWEQANEQLAPLGVVFMSDHPDLVSTGAIGGYDGEIGKVVLNAAHFPIPEQWLRPTIEHELTHREQMKRAAERGGDPAEITGRKLELYRQGGDWRKAYGQDPLEMQALARNAVSAARRAGRNPKNLLRRGKLGGYAPLRPGDPKRFGKYAYQMSEEP